MKHYLAIDIGASSGRHIVGWFDGATLRTEEVYRFPNDVYEENGHLCWNMEALVKEVKNGIRAAFKKYPEICRLSIDTWGVDYVLLRDNKMIHPCYAYRDSRTKDAVSLVHDAIPFPELYKRTGCQFQPFNTIYQLYDDKIHGYLEKSSDLLMIPEYLIYRLTGVKVREFTNATTTGMVNAETKNYDPQIIKALGFPEKLFPKLSCPGNIVGCLLPSISAEIGGKCEVVLCATHDTASAVEGIPMQKNAPYISSGTWSLLGVKTPMPLTDMQSRIANYSNEGGIGYNRYQKNIMGMWIINCLKKELCPEMTFNEIVKSAENSKFNELVDVNAPQFLAPKSMKAEFDEAVKRKPSTFGDYFRCAYRSLALSYKCALEELESNTGMKYDSIYIVGGGAKNDFLNHLVEQFSDKKVIALPIEATALGNLRVQMEA